MNNWMKFFSCILIQFLVVFGLAAQTTEDVIYLENGSVIRGEILEYNRDGEVKIKIMGGSVLVYKSSDVIKTTKEPILFEKIRKAKRPMHKSYNKGRYHTAGIETMIGMGSWGMPTPAFAAHTTSGYHFHRLLGIGGGIGINAYEDDIFIPIYANIRGNLMKSSTSIYYDINVGYGASLGLNTGMFIKNKSFGGFYIRPAIGIRFPSTRRTHLFMDFGYTIQFAKYDMTDWNGNPVYEKRTYYRPSLKIGVTF